MTEVKKPIYDTDNENIRETRVTLCSLLQKHFEMSPLLKKSLQILRKEYTEEYIFTRQDKKFLKLSFLHLKEIKSIHI